MAGAVTRFYPKNLPLKTEMDEDKIVVFLYEPPGGVAPVPADASTPVLFFSGEWGYTPLHQDASCDLAARGRYVLGIDSSEYFKKMLGLPDPRSSSRRTRPSLSRYTRPVECCMIRFPSASICV